MSVIPLGKAEKLVRVMSVLLHRGSVSIKELMDEIGISRRTCFRYLNAVSEQGIPLYYDELSERYRLVAGAKSNWNNLTVSDSNLILCLLSLAAGSLNDAYLKQLGRIIDKLPISQRLRHVYQRETVSEELVNELAVVSTENLHRIQLLHAVESDVGVTITFTDSSGGNNTRRLSRPGVELSKSWGVIDIDAPQHPIIEGKSISSVLITG